MASIQIRIEHEALLVAMPEGAMVAREGGTVVHCTRSVRRACRNLTLLLFAHSELDHSYGDLHFPRERVPHRTLASDSNAA